MQLVSQILDLWIVIFALDSMHYPTFEQMYGSSLQQANRDALRYLQPFEKAKTIFFA